MSGPNYAAATPPPGLTENEVGQGGDNMINGAGPAPSSSTARTDDRTLPQPVGTSSVVEAADFLSTPATTKGPEANEHAIPTAPPSLSREAAPSSSGDQLHAGVFAFSPPEELPQEVRGSDVAGQSFWFARIGEFVQRRVAQAGAAMSPILESRSRGTLRQVVTSPPRAQRLFSPEAEQAMSQWTRRAPHLYTPEQRVQQQEGSSNGSLTQEQVMAEVQKQVKFEMRAHEAERYQLAEENNQLKKMLERVLLQVQAQSRESTGTNDAGGIPQGPQGSDHLGGGGGNPGGLPRPLSVPGSYLSVPKPGSAPQGSPGVLHGCPSAGQQGSTVPGGNPLGVRAEQGQSVPKHAGPSDGGASAVNGSGLADGQRSQSTAGAVPIAASGLPPGGLSHDLLGALVQGMAQLQTAMSQSLTSKGKDVEIVKPGLAELPRLPELSQNSAIDVGDWLHGLHNHMGDLSNSSSQWWNEVMGCLTKFYEAYLAASHVGKLALRAVGLRDFGVEGR